MLAIRMQRTGRSGHSQFRVIIQDARAHPKSGRIVQYLGSYDPHTKTASLKTDEINQYLKNGAQPSERVVKLLKGEGVKIPKWAVSAGNKKKAIKNPEKLRRNRPAGAPAPEPKPAEEAATDTPAEVVAEDAPEAPETPAETPAPETIAKSSEPTSDAEATAESQSEKPTESATEPEASKEA